MRLKDFASHGKQRRLRQLLIEPPSEDARAAAERACHTDKCCRARAGEPSGANANSDSNSAARPNKSRACASCAQPENRHGQQEQKQQQQQQRQEWQEQRPRAAMAGDRENGHQRPRPWDAGAPTSSTSVIGDERQLARRRRDALDTIGQNWGLRECCARGARLCCASVAAGAPKSTRAGSAATAAAEAATTAAAAAPTAPRRKSELTSFLTILFGSLLAGVALLLLDVAGPPHGRLALCAQPPAAGAASNASSALDAPLNVTAAAAAVARTIEALASTSGPAAASSFSLMTSEVGAASAAATDAATNAKEEEEESDGRAPAEPEEADDGTPEVGGPPGDGTRLGALLTSSAAAGVDALLGHLQPSERAAGGDLDDGAEDAAPIEAEEKEQEERRARPEVAAHDDQAAGAAARGPRATPLKGDAGRNGTSAATVAAAAAAATVASTASGSINANTTHDEQTLGALRVYAKWRAAADDLIELFSRKLMPALLERGYDADPATVAGLLQVFNGIRQLRPWAVKLLDASFKLAPGVLAGTQSDFGDFDECLGIRADDPSGVAASLASEGYASGELDPVDPSTGLRSSTLVGRYCLADVEFPKPARKRRRPPLTNTTNGAHSHSNRGSALLDEFEPIELRKSLLDFSSLPAYRDTIFVETGNFFHMLYVDPVRVGVCLTNKIDPESLQQVVNKLLDEFKITINFRGRCATKYERAEWTLQQRVSAHVLLVACALVLASTLLDLLHAKLNKLPCPEGWLKARLRLQLAAAKHRPLFTSFSLVRNTRRLFRAPTASASATTPAAANSQFANLARAGAGAGLGYAASLAATSLAAGATSASSLADSSVESSPAIERRCSSASTTAGELSAASRNDLIGGASHLNCADLAALQSALKFSGASSTSSSGGGNAATAAAAANQARPGAANLASLHGIRVLTMAWMIINHTYMFGGFFVLWAHRRLIEIAEWPKSLSFQMVLNGWLTVETYFFLSALIIVLAALPAMRAHKFNYPAYVAHRLLRLVPAYAGLVCLNFLWPLISAGPVWLVKGKSFVQTPCEQNLWTNFLFINNWIWPEKQCMVHTWFLSADFQLYLLAPVIVYLLYRRPALGHSVNLLVAVCASVLSGFVIYANELLPTTLINKLEFDAIKQQLSYSYFATYQHMGPYCLGILTGYLLYTRPHVRLPKHLTWLLWLLLPPLSFTTLLLTYLWNGAYDDPELVNPSPLVSAFYVAIHRTIWTALVAWLVFACATGRAKMLASALSHSLFLPLSRLSYSIYLVHLPVIMFRALNLRHTLEWTDQNILWEACGNFVVSTFMGYFLNVTFESPIINLENVLLARRRRSPALLSSAASSSSSPQTARAGLCAAKMAAACGDNNNKCNAIGAHACADKQQQLQVQQRHQNGAFPHTNKCALIADGSALKSPLGDPLLVPNQLESHNHSHRPNQHQHQHQHHHQHRQANEFAYSPNSSASSSPPRSTTTTSTDELDLDEAAGGAKGEALRENVGALAPRNTPRGPALAAGPNSPFVSSCTDEQQQLQQHQGRPDGGATALSARLDERPLRPRPGRAPQLPRGGPRADWDQDVVYNLGDEYRHYAPAGYQQWRRTMNSAALLERQQQQQHRQRLGAAEAQQRARPQQYATLARSSRLHQDPSLGSAQLAAVAGGRSGLPWQSPGRHRPGDDAHDPLFPNASELGLPTSLLSYDTVDYEPRPPRPANPLESGSYAARNRRQGRYNTLTSASTSEWRLQWATAADNGQSRNELLASSAWDAPAVGGPGALLIPRIDSSTLRRGQQQQEQLAARGSLATLGQHQAGAMLAQEPQFDSSRILEEPTGEEEISAL